MEKITEATEQESECTRQNAERKDSEINKSEKGCQAYLSCNSGPDFQRVVIRATDDAVAAELKAGNHMVIVSFQHLEIRKTKREVRKIGY